MKILRRLSCKHEVYEWVRNLHGAEIIGSGFKRSVWKCLKCGKKKLSDRIFNGKVE